MITTKTIDINGRPVEALCMKLQEKNLIVLRGAKGYIMCGYLNMEAANKFNEVAVKITGVASIDDALKAKAAEVSLAAEKMNIKKDMPVKDILSFIA
jgi:uncharacterized protein YunC (DUF1805 family)